MLVKWKLLCTRTNGVACPCIGVVRLIVGVRCIVSERFHCIDACGIECH